MAELLSPTEALRLLREDGVALIDVRPAPEFARGYPDGALSVPYSHQGLALRVGVADPSAGAVVLVVSDETQAEAARRQLEQGDWLVHGYGPADAAWWRAAGRGWRTLRERLIADLVGDPDVVIVDVREPMEWEAGHVPGAILAPLGRLRDELHRIPPDKEVVVICETGIRSAMGASILLKEGLRMVSHAPDGTAGVRRTGGPLAFADTEPIAQR